MTKIKIVVCAVAVFLAVGSRLLSGEPDAIPRAAKDALAKMDQEIGKAKTAALLVLKKSLQDEMEKGNLATANLIQEKIDELSPPSFVPGKWTQEGTSYSYDFKDNGDVIANDGNRGKYKVSNSKVVATFPNGSFVLELPMKDGTVKATWSQGGEFIFKKAL